MRVHFFLSVVSVVMSRRRWMDKAMKDSTFDWFVSSCLQSLLFSDILKPQPEPPCPEGYTADGVKRYLPIPGL